MKILAGVGRTILKQTRQTAKRVLVRQARKSMSRVISKAAKRLFG